MNHLPVSDAVLVADIRQLIDSARQRTALAVNAELTLLYWQIGRRIQDEVLKGERAAYGRGWGEKQIRHCLRAAETFPDEAIVSALRGKLRCWNSMPRVSMSPST
ncbi:DUF1016 N-terminal domain-containing protein [Nitrosomonas sp.]|uniref:DUF1016 N-terminal domain-containing protein n=1 Tax=Nitrosomonas sp. TaxID=42353 RepID=UPI00272F25CD|nr:DUF1016 N-terminal domain-containing protein [Nitrosomonas sp.]MDP1786298.1 DUF1016 N-terminal domain-containing protein [Nitrosomonas sp.]